LNLPFFIARRYLLKQKGTFSSFIIRLAIFATALSVAVMVVAMAFITGFKYEIREKLFSFWGHVHITEFSPNASNLIVTNPIREDGQLIREVSALPHVTQVVPYALRPAILQANHAMEGIKLKGIRPAYRFPSSIELHGGKIDFSDTSYSKDVILSQSTANRLKVSTGDHVLLYFLEPGATVPRIRKVMVAGLYHTGMDEVDKEFAICDIRLLQRINNWAPDNINGYQVDLDQPKLADSLSNKIFNDYLDAPLTTNTMRDIYPNIFDWLQLQDINAQIVLIIMAVVAVINLAVALLILIVEQARMTGLLAALGMKQKDMQQIFLYHAGLIASVGILAGNILGIGICLLQLKTGFLKLSEATYYMSQVPVRINWWYVLLIDASTLLVCILCMWLPSLYIRRIQPARVLQFK
jgi:lipoprotein-releasing system permease protein